MRLLRLTGSALLAAAALLLTAAPAHAIFTDPVGDTFGTGPVQIDITGGDATFAGGNTTFTVNFASAISAPSAFAANSVVGFIDIDTDKNAATGGSASFPSAQPGQTLPGGDTWHNVIMYAAAPPALPPGQNLTGGNNWINYFIPPNPGTPSIPGPLIATGDEYYVDLASEGNHAGTVDIINTSNNTVAFTVPITFTATSFTLTAPVVGTGDGSLNYDVLVGTYAENTDRAPNGSTPFTSTPASVPEPSSLASLGVGLAALGLRLRSRRRGASVARLR